MMLDETDRRLITATQAGLPPVDQPYARIASRAQESRSSVPSMTTWLLSGIASRAQESRGTPAVAPDSAPEAASCPRAGNPQRNRQVCARGGRMGLCEPPAQG